MKCGSHLSRNVKFLKMCELYFSIQDLRYFNSFPSWFNLHESGLRNKVDLRGMKCGSHLEFPQYYTCQLLAPYSVFKYCKVLLNTVKVLSIKAVKFLLPRHAAALTLQLLPYFCFCALSKILQIHKVKIEIQVFQIQTPRIQMLQNQTTNTSATQLHTKHKTLQQELLRFSAVPKLPLSQSLAPVLAAKRAAVSNL